MLGRTRRCHLVHAAALSTLLGVALTACSSSPATTATSTVAAPSSTSSVTTRAPVRSSTSSPILTAEQLPVQKALGVLRDLFVRAGVDPDDSHTASLGLASCPLGRPSELVATPPAPALGASVRLSPFLNKSQGVLDVICRFSSDSPAGAATSVAGRDTSPVIQYDASYIPPPQLKDYLRFLDNRGFEQRTERYIDGVVYSSCSAPAGTTTTVAAGRSSCSALWYFRQLVIGVQVSSFGGAAVDVTKWLTSVVQPIIGSLAATDVASVEVPASTVPLATTTTTR